MPVQNSSNKTTNEKAYVDWVNHHLRSAQEFPIENSNTSNDQNNAQNTQNNNNNSNKILFIKQLEESNFQTMLALISVLNKKANIYSFSASGFVTFSPKKRSKLADRNYDNLSLTGNKDSNNNSVLQELLQNNKNTNSNSQKINQSKYLLDYIEKVEGCPIQHGVDRNNIFSNKLSIQKFVLSLAKFYKPKCIRYKNNNNSSQNNTNREKMMNSSSPRAKKYYNSYDHDQLISENLGFSRARTSADIVRTKDRSPRFAKGGTKIGRLDDKFRDLNFKGVFLDYLE